MLLKSLEILKTIRHSKPAWRRDFFGIEHGTSVHRDCCGKKSVEPHYESLTRLIQMVLNYEEFFVQPDGFNGRLRVERGEDVLNIQIVLPSNGTITPDISNIINKAILESVESTTPDILKVATDLLEDEE